MALAATAVRWDASRMPSLEGKLVVITGANAGIGFEAAVAMAARGAAHVILACRSEARGRAAEQEIRARTGNEAAEFMALDVGSLASVRAFVAAFHARFDRLDILVNNAGVMHPPTPTTADGFEAHFGVNHLGHFYLTALLFESLQNARDEARVVCVSSTNHRYVSAATDFGALGREKTGRRMLPMDAYSTSKLCNLLFTYELSRRLARAQNIKIKAVACHPGITMTNIITDAVMVNRLPAWAQRAFSKAVALLPIFQSPEVGALPTLFAATEPGVASGEYIGPDGWRAFWGYPTRDESSPLSHSEEAATELWARSEELLQIQFDVR